MAIDIEEIDLPPQPLKPGRIRRGVSDGMLNVPVSQVILDEPRIRALVGQGEAAGVAEHVRMGDQGQPGPFAIGADQDPHHLATEGAAAIADEKGVGLGFQPGPLFQPDLDDPDFISAKRVRGREAVFQAGDMEDAAVEVHLGQDQAAGLGYA